MSSLIRSVREETHAQYLYIFVLIGYKVYSIVTYLRLEQHDSIVTTGAGAVVTKMNLTLLLTI